LILLGYALCNAKENLIVGFAYFWIKNGYFVAEAIVAYNHLRKRGGEPKT
jgi:hypothetical protein